MRQIELLIVGGGVAGQAAALTAAHHGVKTLLVDEGPVPAGWMRRQTPLWYGERLPSCDGFARARERYVAARPALTDAATRGVEVRLGQFCWGIFEDRVAGLSDGVSAELVRAEQFILATGSTDMPLAFQGRTLPGVLGGMAALDLLATWGSLGGRRVVVLGAGNLGLEVARRARAAGHEVVTIADISEEPPGEAAALTELEAAGVEFVQGVTVNYARGTDELEQVMLVPVDRQGRRAAGPSYPVRADTLVVAIGRMPAIELAYLAGCRIGFDAAVGGYVPWHSTGMESSEPGVYVVGDAAGAPDALFPRPGRAQSQGRIAAIGVAIASGNLEAGGGRALLAAEQESLERAGGAGQPPRKRVTADGQLNLWPRAAMQLANDDVIICRCEGITRKELLAAMEVVGDGVPDELKRVTRAGMGQCQGRGCRTIIAGLLAQRLGVDMAAIPLASFRPPMRPISLGALASAAPPEEPLAPAFARLAEQLEADDAAGIMVAGKLAARYKLREENHLALAHGLGDAEIEQIVHDLAVTVKHVNVH